jgi:LmbE family N-acetylglucosaminyl deacetylase
VVGEAAPLVISLHLPDTGGSPLEALCLGAHADDLEIGCGGALLTLLAARPVRVRWIVFSGSETRRAEAAASAGRFLGEAVDAGAGEMDHEITVHDFRDGFFPSERGPLKDVFRDIAATGDPHVIFTHDEADLHQDHATLAALTRETFRDHLVLGYEIPKFDGDLTTPNLYVPLADEVRRRKVELLLEAFPSQRDKHWFDPETFHGLMRLRGVECAAPSGWAEGFHVRKARLLP